MLNNNSLIDEVTPLKFFVSQNYPNPFREKTVIKYCVAFKTRVRICVFDHYGNVVEELVNEEKQPGTYEVEFKSSFDHLGENRKLDQGYYSYTMNAEDYVSEVKWLCINNKSGKINAKSILHSLFLLIICFAELV